METILDSVVSLIPHLLSFFLSCITTSLVPGRMVITFYRLPCIDRLQAWALIFSVPEGWYEIYHQTALTKDNAHQSKSK